MASKTKGSSSSGSPRGGRPPEGKHASREGSSGASKPPTDGEAVWVAPYHLRPASRDALLAALPLLDEKTAAAALEALERHLAQFVAFKREGEFKRHATPTGETRRRLKALRDAANLTLQAAAELAAAAEGLGVHDVERLGLARHFQRDGVRGSALGALREVEAEIREAKSAENDENAAKAAALADLSRFALSQLSSEKAHGRGPKPNLAAEFLLHSAALVWEDFTGERAARGDEHTPSPFERFAHAVFRVAGAQFRGLKRPGDKLLRRFLKVWPDAKLFAAHDPARAAKREREREAINKQLEAINKQAARVRADAAAATCEPVRSRQRTGPNSSRRPPK